MIAYILDNQTFTTKDILEFSEYAFKEDIEFSEKSSITVSKKPNAETEDFIFCKDENDSVFVGLCDSYKSSQNKSSYSLTIRQKECLFDRDVFVASENLISETGIEDFIVQAIKDNFSASGDAMMDKPYISVAAYTHTPIAAKVDAENGVYNLKTYLGNAKQYYGIFLDFSFSDGKLIIDVCKKENLPIPIDIEVSDVSGYTETYEVSVLAKLLVHWKLPDTQDPDGNEVIGASEKRTFYLLADRTITEDSEDENRASGTVRSIYIEAGTEEEMIQAAYNEFLSNSYNHKIYFNLNRNSRLYPESRFYVGKMCTIKTKTGIQSSIVTKSEIKSASAMRTLTFGTLKVTLIEKLRRAGN